METMPKVLIVEDDSVIASMIEALLTEHGYEVCDVARTIDQAVELGLEQRPQIVIIDIWLADGGIGTEVAVRLGSLGRLGVLYATGDMSGIALTVADGDACLTKPYRPQDLMRSLEIVSGILTTGAASYPFPPGFHLLASAEVTSDFHARSLVSALDGPDLKTPLSRDVR
jgi:CheY-like chemotaxis protein